MKSCYSRIVRPLLTHFVEKIHFSLREVFTERKLENLGKTERPFFNEIFVYKWMPSHWLRNLL